MPDTSNSKHPLREKIGAIVGPEHVTTEEFSRRCYTRGPFYAMGGGPRGRTPGLVVRPRNSEEVAGIVRLANEYKIPIVPKGGGGSIATFPPLHVGTDLNILIDTQRMNRIIDLDRHNMTVTAECGVILSHLADVARQNGFQIHTVDVPIHMDTVGGVLSGFIGGGEPSDVAVCGTMNRHLVGLKVVLPNGEIVETGGGPGTNIHQAKFLHREAGGPDTSGIFLGDGGAFGIKTEATFNLYPYPEIFLPGIAEMASEEGMWRAFAELVATEPYPYTRLLAFREADGPWLFFHVIRAHTRAEADLRKATLEKIVKTHGGRPTRPSDAIMQIANMFSARRLGQQTLPVASAMTYFGEAILPRAKALDYLADLNRLLDETVGDLDIYKRVSFTIPYLRATTITGILLYFGKSTTRDQASRRIYEQAVHKFERLFAEKYGGWSETCQGECLAQIAANWSPTYKAFMRSLKKALDPNNIMMPGLWRI